MGQRYTGRNQLKIPGERGGRHLSETPVGKRVIAKFKKPLVERLKDNIDPPGRLAETLKAIPPEDLAEAILVPFLHGMFTVWRDERKGKKSSPARQNLSATVGQYVHTLLVRHKLLTDGEVPDRKKLLAQLAKKPRHRRKKDEPARKRGRKRNRDARNLTFAEWDRRDLARVGDWLIEQAMALPHFRKDRGRKPYLPALAPDWMTPEALNCILGIKRYFIGLDDQQLPDFKPIPPWTAPVRGNLRFVDTYRRDTQGAIAKAFEHEFDHARGVSALEAVQYKLDPFMVDVVEAARPVLLEREMGRKKTTRRNRRNRRFMLYEDIEFARVIGDRPFRMQHHCDFRGRIYQVPYLNMQREDHVRCLFKFADGKKLGSSRAGLRKLGKGGDVGGYTDHEMLEIHCANLAGQDKLLWNERLQWVKDNRSLIEAAGNDDPIATLGEWQDFDKPFCFVAACRELISARNDPHFVSCLPVFFDATANGYQHLGMLVRDKDTLKKVNVIGNERSDLYTRVAGALKLILENATGEHADSWRKRYAGMSPSERRALVKQPTMTFVYGVTKQGMNLQAWGEHDELFPGEEAPDGYFGFIGEKIELAIRKELPGAYGCREYLCHLTACTLDKGRFIQTIGPTGFPLISSYLEREIIDVYAHDGGRMRIKGRETAEVLRDEAIRSTAPHFVHSLDAAHAIRVALGCGEVGIDLAVNHDCFGCLAADAADMNRIIRREFILLHSVEWLALLHAQNAPDSPAPPPGGLKIEDIDPNDAEYFTS